MIKNNIKTTERNVTFDEAMNLWQQGKCVCFTLDGIEYVLNAPYSEENRLQLTPEEIEKGNWTELVIEKL